jgi:hypothetical protein
VTIRAPEDQTTLARCDIVTCFFHLLLHADASRGSQVTSVILLLFCQLALRYDTASGVGLANGVTVSQSGADCMRTATGLLQDCDATQTRRLATFLVTRDTTRHWDADFGDLSMAEWGFLAQRIFRRLPAGKADLCIGD